MIVTIKKLKIMRVSWIQNGSNYRRVEGEISNVEQPPVGIYNIGLDRSGWFIEYYSDKFVFDYKIYGLEKRFMNHVLKAYENTKGNFGILMNGTKGTGKSVTAKILANTFNIPIIIVKSFGENNQGLIEYLASFNFDCVFFFDEFEKNFDKDDSSILQIMDGVYNSSYRKIFLLTTNETHINDNLLSRPSRLRYIREFGNLEKDIVEEYLNDNLNNKEDAEEVLNYVDSLEISTIDILKTIVEDVNIFGVKEFIETKNYFNVKTNHFVYSVDYVNASMTWLRSNNYSIKSFLYDCKLKNDIAPNKFEYSSVAAFKEAVKEYESTHETIAHIIAGDVIDSDVCIKNIKVGSSWGYYDYEVQKVDLDNNIIITISGDDVYIYRIINPEQKPSLYSSKNMSKFDFMV